MHSTRGEIIKPFKIRSPRHCFISFVLKLENEPPSYCLPMPILCSIPLAFVQDVHLDIRVSWKLFEALMFIIAWSQAVGGDSSVNLFFSSHSNFTLPLIRALINYLGLPLSSRKFVIFSPWRSPHIRFFCKYRAIKNLRNVCFFWVGTRQSSWIVGARNPDSVISSRGSLFKRRYLYIQPVIHPFSGFVHTTCIPPALLASPPVLKIGRLLTTASKSWLQSTALLPSLTRHAIVTPPSALPLSGFLRCLTSKVLQLQQEERQIIWWFLQQDP